MSMMDWQDFEERLKVLNTTNYTSSDPRSAHKAAMIAIRRAFLDMESKAAERDELRYLLIEQGVENARLTVLVAQANAVEELAPQPTPTEGASA